jgi:putative NIF3 family GTP cyclohydrolase 1 type 2
LGGKLFEGEKRAFMTGNEAVAWAALAAKADIYVTGDVRYHDAEKAVSLGLCVVDAGHHATEAQVAPCMAAYLLDHINTTAVACEVLVAKESSPISLFTN